MGGRQPSPRSRDGDGVRVCGGRVSSPAADAASAAAAADDQTGSIAGPAGGGGAETNARSGGSTARSRNVLSTIRKIFQKMKQGKTSISFQPNLVVNPKNFLLCTQTMEMIINDAKMYFLCRAASSSRT